MGERQAEFLHAKARTTSPGLTAPRTFICFMLSLDHLIFDWQAQGHSSEDDGEALDY
jgi:hypothetical protein